MSVASRQLPAAWRTRGEAMIQGVFADSVEFRVLRKRCQKTQEEWGELFSVSRTMVTHWEAGRRQIPATVLERARQLVSDVTNNSSR